MSGRTYSHEEMAAAWESGYWHGASHTGPLNDAAVRAKNPYINTTDKEGDAGSPAKKNTDAANENPTKK